MNGLSYIKSRSSAKRKPTSLQDRADLKDAILNGVRRESLQNLCTKHPSEVKQLQAAAAAQFKDWQHKLRLGWNLLFYGYGSKSVLLRRFGDDLGEEDAALLVNGCGHPLNVRLLLQKIISTLRSSTDFNSPSRNGDSRELLQSIAQGLGPLHLYLIIDGLDSPALRGPEAQDVLSQLAALPNIHLIASIDHVNAPLMWNKRMAAGYNFLHMDVTTFLPYRAETIHCRPLLLATRTESDKQGAAFVLKTLPPKARQIFQVLAEHQLMTEEPGMSIHELYKPCRDQFLVANELALRAHLGEFKDHDLVHTKRSAEGVELCFIPQDQEALEAMLAEISAAHDGS